MGSEAEWHPQDDNDSAIQQDRNWLRLLVHNHSRDSGTLDHPYIISHRTTFRILAKLIRNPNKLTLPWFRTLSNLEGLGAVQIVGETWAIHLLILIIWSVVVLAHYILRCHEDPLLGMFSGHFPMEQAEIRACGWCTDLLVLRVCYRHLGMSLPNPP